MPITFQDVVVIFCTASGQRKGQFVQISDARKIYGQSIDGESWSAIQLTTAAGVCGVVDLYFDGKLTGSGLVRQEQVKLSEFLANRFGRQYRGSRLQTHAANSKDAQEVGHDQPRN